MASKTKKNIVLITLFIVPLLFYILLSMGINNFAKLPVVTQNVVDVSTLDKKVKLKDRISLVVFLGDDIQKVKGALFNLNQKIYKMFYGFKDFQLVVIVPNGNEAEINTLKKEIGAFTDMQKYRFVFAEKQVIKAFYSSFKTNEQLNDKLYSSKAFIVDKDINLRGRTDDKDSLDGKLFGYNMRSVGELNDKMKDDVKIVLAEYRLALKKNNADREI